MRATVLISSALILAASLASALSLADAARAQELQARVRTLPTLPYAPLGEDQIRHRSMLPDGLVAEGRGRIQAAWLTGPTKRYAHAVLGDAIEASGLAVQNRDGELLSLKLPDAEVFEDRVPRLVDLNGDGEDEILLVKSHLSLGSRLTLIDLVDGALSVVAEGEPVGRSFRWLNPIGVGDFNGDGRPEVAHVETPHIGGFLVLSQLVDSRLIEFQRVEGFSNHRLGSRELGLSAILDVNRDGVEDLVVPDNARTRLRVVTFAGGTMRELAIVELGSELTSSIQLVPSLGNAPPELALQLANGQILGIVFGP